MMTGPMSKYGSGVSIKTVIESEIKKVSDILDKAQLTEDDKKAVIDALEEMAYQ